MTQTVRLPKLGDTADTVVVVQWLAKPGDTLDVGHALVRVETAKVEIDVPTPVAGRLLRRLADEDDELPVGAPLAEIDTD